MDNMKKLEVLKKKRRRMLKATIRKAERVAAKSGEWQEVYVCDNPADGFAFAEQKSRSHLRNNTIGEVRVWKYTDVELPCTEFHPKHSISRNQAVIEKDYRIAASDDLGGALCIQPARAEVGQESALLEARIDGIPLIRNLPFGIDKHGDAPMYIDTPDNRKHISEFLRECYSIVWS